MRIINKYLIISIVLVTSFSYSQELHDLSGNEKNTTIPFYSNLYGYFSYRIPTLIKSENAIIAFAEARKNSTSDFGDIDIVYRRSLNHGKTWEKLQILYDHDSIAVQNPVPVFVPEKNKIVLLFNVTSKSEHDILNTDYDENEQRKAFITSSLDDGETWTKPKEITSQVKLKNWRWHALGPVHGIQLANGDNKGRLVVPVAISVEKGNNAYCMALIYSDDQGDSWHIGATDTNLLDAVQCNETTIVELNDGTIYVNTRDHLGGSRLKNRGETYSYDGGLNFDKEIIESNQFPSPIVQSALVRWSSSNNGNKDLLLFSTPSNRNKRENLIIMASKDESKTWFPLLKINHGFAAYSDMVKIDEKWLGVLYETDEYKKIKFKRVALNKL